MRCDESYEVFVWTVPGRNTRALIDVYSGNMQTRYRRWGSVVGHVLRKRINFVYAMLR